MKSFSLKKPVAAAIGAKLPIHKAEGSMIIDIGGGTTDIAVLSMNGIVTARNLNIAGDRLNRDILNYIRDQFKVAVGDKTAEEVKIALASITDTEEESNGEVVVRGRDIVSGLPREVVITRMDVREAIALSINTIVEGVRDVIERTPPEVLSDVMRRGIYLSGGGALIPGIADLLEEVLTVPVIVVPDPLRAVVRGTGMVIENLEHYEDILIKNEDELSPEL